MGALNQPENIESAPLNGNVSHQLIHTDPSSANGTTPSSTKTKSRSNKELAGLDITGPVSFTEGRPSRRTPNQPDAGTLSVPLDLQSLQTYANNNHAPIDTSHAQYITSDGNGTDIPIPIIIKPSPLYTPIITNKDANLIKTAQEEKIQEEKRAANNNNKEEGGGGEEEEEEEEHVPKKRRAALAAGRKLSEASFFPSETDSPTIKRPKRTITPSGTYSSFLPDHGTYTPHQPSAKPTGKKPTNAFEAKADISSLITLAIQSKNIGDIIAGIDQRLPAYKGNNIHAKILRQAFSSLQLGHFTVRKVAVNSIAQMLWLLAGKKGDAAARDAASVVSKDALPPSLQPFGTDRPVSNGYSGGDSILANYFGQIGQLQQPPPRRQSASAYVADDEDFLPTCANPGSTMHPSLDLSAFHPSLRKLAEVGRQMVGLRRGDTVTLHAVMKTALLANQKIVYKSKDGTKVSSGVITAHGNAIRCRCGGDVCRSGTQEVDIEVFVSHAGEEGGHERWEDAICFEESSHTVKELLTLMTSDAVAAADIHMDHCYACKIGGDLLCCDGCTTAWHLNCVDMSSVPVGSWLCRLCLSEGRKLRPPPPSSTTSGPGSKGSRGKGFRAPKASGSGAGDGQPRPSKRSLGGYGPSAAHRVTMMAPSAQRRTGRPQRNLNRNKRLFEGCEGGLVDGQTLFYMARGEKVLTGTVVINPAAQSGILCECCSKIISCSQFESHAGHAQRRQPYEHIYTTDKENLKAVAARLPEPEAQEEWDDTDGLDDPDAPISGCVLCRDPEFQRGEFGPRTIMLCDQCEREYHVGCMANADLQKLESLPEGDWFCTKECGRIHGVLRRHVDAGLMPVAAAAPAARPVLPVAEDGSLMLQEQGQGQDPDEERQASLPIEEKEEDTDGIAVHTESQPYTWQVLNGKNGIAATTHAIKAAADILQESFDPIIDLSTNTDLLPLMLYARQYREWDYRGMYTLLLRYKGKPAVAAIVRICGPQIAELPLIATKSTARRRGHARILVNLFEDLLKEAGVHTLVLPAAHETVQTWKNGFNFVDMPEVQVGMAKQQLRILVFPGTEVLWKTMEGVSPPTGHHVLKLLPTAGEIMVVRKIMQELVTAVCVAGGEEVAAAKKPEVVVEAVVAADKDDKDKGGELKEEEEGKKENDGGVGLAAVGIVDEGGAPPVSMMDCSDGADGGHLII